MLTLFFVFVGGCKTIMGHNPAVEMAEQCKTMQAIAKNQTLLRE